MIKVWTDAADAGLLDRFGARGSTFAYQTNAPPLRAVSVTMPLRIPSYNVPFGLLPIFEMNLPEGVLRERLRLAFAKATGTFDDFDLLGIVGRSQVGRIRYTGAQEDLQERSPFSPSMRSSTSAAAASCFVTCSINSPPFPASAAYSQKSWCVTKPPPRRCARRTTGSRSAIGVRPIS